MARRFDLSQKHNDDLIYANRRTRPFLLSEQEANNEDINEPVDENNEEKDLNNKEEAGNNQTVTYTEYVDNVDGDYEVADDSYAPNKPNIRQRIANAMNRKKNANSALGVIGSNATESIKDGAKGAAVQFIKKNPIVKKVVLITAIVLIVILFFVIFVTAVVDMESKKGLATGGYYALKCPEVTVIFVDKKNNYEPIGSETYPFEEYVAGVVRGEVLMLHNVEIFKEFALLARTYAAGKLGDDCTIEASDRRQVFARAEDSPSYSDMVYEAVDSTKGMVILQNGDLVNVQYDAFCSIEVTDQYYTIKQQNQRIPRSWADSQPGIPASWKQGNCAGNHGRGVSTWGSYYLVTEQGYTYDEALKYYLGDDITLSTRGFMSAIDGLEIKDTSNATPLSQDLASALAEHGSSIQELNSFIHESVENNGVGTRAGVVTAAVSLINYLYDGMGVKIPYYWGGKYQSVGANPNWGGYVAASSKGHTHGGLDCSGFVSWAIVNGGYNFGGASTMSFDSQFSGDSCYMSEPDCIGQPGDLLNSTNCGGGVGHVQMIVAVDESSGVYYIAESSYGVTMSSLPMHSGRCGSSTKILRMDNYYNNPANVNYNY